MKSKATVRVIAEIEEVSLNKEELTEMVDALWFVAGYRVLSDHDQDLFDKLIGKLEGLQKGPELASKLANKLRSTKGNQP